MTTTKINSLVTLYSTFHCYIMLKAAHRVSLASSFQAMAITKQAQLLREQGKDVIGLSIGEPDFTAPNCVIEKLTQAAQEGLSGYTAALGISPLRSAIARYYNEVLGAHITPERVVITTGASGALSLACLTLMNPNDEILLPEPYYPGNITFITTTGAHAKTIPCTADERYQLSAEKIKAHWGEHTTGILIASPSNPTGTSITEDELKNIIAFVTSKNGFIILDEIYLGLNYDGKPVSGLAYDDNLIVINSFSKFFNMTGWRLGWMIAPEPFIPSIEKLSSSLNICAPTLSQQAALACFTKEAFDLYEERRLAFKERRDYLLVALERLGFSIPVKPDGAFYIYADISKYSNDSMAFCLRLLHEVGIAITPGIDFGATQGHHMIRLSYATSLEQLKEAIARLEKFLPTLS